MTPKLLRTSTLTINRFGEGYWDVDGNWVDGGIEPPFDIQCNIQPFKDGKERSILPEGTTADDAVTVYSKTKLNITDQLTDTKGDYFTLDGFTYKVYRVENWSRYGLKTDHYKHTAVRKDQPTNGDL